jgi:hypothetical protein
LVEGKQAIDLRHAQLLDVAPAASRLKGNHVTHRLTGSPGEAGSLVVAGGVGSST